MPLPSFQAALEIVQQQAASVALPAATEVLPLLEAQGRVLAGPITADRDQPPFDRSTRDGFAVRAAELSAGGSLAVVGLLRAGEAWAEGRSDARFADDNAIEIMTGAPVPAGADAVVMVEHVERSSENKIRLLSERTLQGGDNIVPRGAEAREDDELVPAGTRITTAEIAIAAACGFASVMVYRRPRVAIVATGDELVDVAETPAAHQIRNSNTYAIASAVLAAGGEPVMLVPAKDSAASLDAAILKSAGCDLLVLSGGVSAGKYDLVEPALERHGGGFHFTGVAIQPGKPVVFGSIAGAGGGVALPRYFFGLPGNPVSTQVTFHLFVEPLLRALGGERAVASPRFVQATLSGAVSGKAGLTRFLPAILTAAVNLPTVRLTAWQGSGDLHANARANCYAVLEEDGRDLPAGETITVLLR